MCACISRHLCLHVLTYVTSYVVAFTLTHWTFVVTHMVQAGSTNVLLLTVLFRDTYNLCHDMQTHAFRNALRNAHICNNKCIRSYFAKICFFDIFVITLNRALFSQNKTLCICWCIYLQIHLHIHLHLFRICLHLFQHLRFVSVHLQTHNM